MTLTASDRSAFTDLVHRYGARVDDRQFDAVAKRFTATAELTVPAPPTTLEPVRRHRGHAAISAPIASVATAVTRGNEGRLRDRVDATRIVARSAAP
jgi:3-phenylpropionate/cinnamic acid dioxygenase small subunit